MINNIRIVLLGAPGSGKGTLGKYLVDKYHFKHISTGDMFRSVIASNESLGQKVKSIVATGALVDDETTNAVVKNEIANLVKQNKSFILDGYPRTVNQAQFLGKIASPNLILLIDVKKELAIKRIVGRRLCPVCGAIYNIFFKKPKIENICDKDNATLIQRKDDNYESINQRFDLFQNVTAALTSYYKTGNKLHRFDANNGIEAILPQVQILIDKTYDSN